MEQEAAKMLNAMFEFIYSQAYAIAEGAIVTFSGSGQWGAGFASIWGAVTQVANNILEPIGVFIVVVMFLLSLVDRVSTEQFSLENLLKDIVKLCMGLYLVTNAVEIVVGCIEIGNGILTSAAGANGFGGFITKPPESEFADFIDGNMLEEIGNFVVLVIFLLLFIIFMIIELILLLIMKVICLIRTLEIALRTAMAPIALSDTFAGNILNSHAIGFIRSFAALCLQGVFITIIAYMVPVFWNGLFDSLVGVWGLFGALINMLIITAALTLLMFKSGAIAKDMLGAR